MQILKSIAIKVGTTKLSVVYLASFLFVQVVLMTSVVLADGPAVPAGSAPVTGAAAAAGTPPQPGFGSMLFPFVAMFAVVYFLMIRPQQKKMKEQQGMIASLKHGDEIVTSSGILGTITGITDKVVTVEVADDVQIKMMKSQVAHVVKGSLKDVAVQ